jgi:tetratricopeptide (TPR) repeat protein
MSDANLDETQPINPEKARAGQESDPAAATQRIQLGGVERTQPVQVAPAGAPEPKKPVYTEPVTKPRKPLRWTIVFAGLALMILLGAGGGYAGYRAALKAKEVAYTENVTQLATEQFMLALQAQTEGRYELAITHIEYVIQLDPNFPGAQEKLTEVMLALAMAKTPTPVITIVVPTITPSPTPDFRGEDEIFLNARSLLENQQWVELLQVLDTLRDKNLSYRAVEVDGMYYVGLRNRGLFKIASGELEGGLYDLALVERFGPLDVDAQGMRTWARLYLSGARYWGVRWDKVVEAFAEIYPYFPNMHDNSGFTATERYRIASLKYGDQLSAAGQYCEALKQYENALGISNPGDLEPTVTAVYEKCNPATATQGPTLTPTPTLTFTIGPSETPTATTEVIPPTATDTPVPPTETPTPTDTLAS